MSKTAVLFSLVACLMGLVVPLATSNHPAVAGPQAPPAPSPVEAIAPLAPAAEPIRPTEAPVKPPLSPLATYTLEIMKSWPHAMPQVPTADYESIATDIAAVAGTPENAVLLAAIGYWEGARYAAYVDDGRCDTWMAEAQAHGRRRADPKTGIFTRVADKTILPREAQRLLAYGDCDGGKAATIFQIHPVENRAAPIHADCSLEVITASRRNAAKCALEMAEQSVRLTGDLSSYTGEWGADKHPKAVERLSFAKNAMKKHPFPR